MKINRIEIKNFYSIKNVTLNFDKFKGIVLVKGKNRDTGGSNGSGKSAIVEGVVWGLFGRTIRKSTEEALINFYAKKACSVRLTINGNVVIERGKKPTYLRFFVGEEEKTLDNALHTQKLIEEYLGTNYKVFLASTVFGQQNNIEFISATPEDKRTIIKNFLNLDSLFLLRDSVKNLKSNYSSNVKKETAIITEHEKSSKQLDKKLRLVEDMKKKYENSSYSDALSLTFEEIFTREQDNTSIDWQKAGIEREISALEECRDELVYRVSQGEHEVSEVCDKCGNLSVTKVTGVMLDEWDHEVGLLEAEIKKYKKNIDGIEKDKKVIPLPSKEYNKIVEYQNLCSQVGTFETLKEELLEKIQSSHDTKQENNTNYEIMRFWEKAFSEAGLVKYIIKNILSFFNGKTNFYLAHLSGGKFFIEFDEELKERIIHNGKEIHYISLSGGEKRKVGLAVMLGLQQLLSLSNKNDSNLMFFDEVAENLDQDGLDGLYILLSELKKEKNLFVITHNNYLKSLMDNVRTLTITKHKGISKLVEK